MPQAVAMAARSTPEAVGVFCMPVSPKRSLSSTAIVRFFGASTAIVASEPTFISISPSPVMTSTRRFGCASASPSPIIDAPPMAPQSGKLLGWSPAAETSQFGAPRPAMTSRSRAVAHEFVDDVAAMQQCVRIGHLRASSLKFLAPSTRCPIRTATGFQVLKARCAAPCTVEAT